MCRYLNVVGVSLAGALLAAGGAAAADLPRRQSAPIVSDTPFVTPPAFTWTGFYAGINGGYAGGSSSGSRQTGAKTKSSAPFGGQAGYNYQWGSVVSGVELDFDRMNVESRGTFAGGAGYKASASYLGTVRGRLGYAVADRLLVFGTAGFALAQMSMSVPDMSRRSKSQWHQGYVVGGGAEYAITDNVTLKAEYLYTRLDKKTYFKDDEGSRASMQLRGSIVRAGLNYKF